MSTKLDLGGIQLPLDAVTQTFGVLAVRGAGKSNLAAVMAEEMFKAGLPFVVIDPVGSWWGLRSSGDGGPGLSIPIFGGKHGDVPLEEAGGQVLADLVVDDRASCVIDVSELSEGAKKRFLLEFAVRVYRRNTEPLHLFLEEADDYIPQRPMRSPEPELLRAWENIVRRGRVRGLGCSLITQRSAVVNKNVLTQVETLFVLRTTSPQDRKAIAAWVEYHGQSKEILETLDKLRAGEAWVWSPQWLGKADRIQIRRRATFDSGATPKNVRSARPAATLADVDLGKVRARMAATIERAKAEDPRELRKRIAELEKQVKAAPAPAKVERIEVPVFKPEQLNRLEAAIGRFVTRVDAANATLQNVMRDAGETLGTLRRAAGQASEALSRGAGHGQRLASAPPATARASETRVARPTPAPGNGHDKLAGGERRILTALAQYPEGRSKRQVALLARYAINGGGFNNYLSSLRSRGLIEGTEPMRITEAGAQALGSFEPLPIGDELLGHWLGQLGKAERAALEVLAAAYPKALAKEDVAERAGYEASGGGFNNALSRLRTLELIEGRSEIRASEDLFG